MLWRKILFSKKGLLHNLPKNEQNENLSPFDDLLQILKQGLFLMIKNDFSSKQYHYSKNNFVMVNT